MKTVVLATEKGGTGKTTLAVNLAVAAERAGLRALLVDLDPQRSAHDWYERRAAETPMLVEIEAAEVAAAVDKATAAGFDVAIFDTAGANAPGVNSAMAAADLILVPAQPSMLDLLSGVKTLERIKRLSRRFSFVLSQAHPQGGYGAPLRVRQALDKLAPFGAVAPVWTSRRAAYQDSFPVGLSVLEWEPDGAAADEIAALWAWVAEKLELNK